MTTTASGYFYPPTSYTDGWRQADQDAADAAETVITTTRAARFYKVADSSALTALAASYTLREGLDFARRDDNKITYRYNGSTWKAWESDWITYTASTTNLTVGTGGSAAASTEYQYSGGRVRVRYKFILGSSGASIGTGPKFTLPVNLAALAHAYQSFSSLANFYDTSANSNYRVPVLSDNTAVTHARFSSGLPQITADVSATVPFTWAAGDVIHGQFEYDPA